MSTDKNEEINNIDSPDVDPVVDEIKEENFSEETAATAESKSEGMSAGMKGLITLIVIFAIGGGLVLWKSMTKTSHTADFSKITEEQMQILLKDANPMLLKRLAEDPELKKEQVKQLKQLLAVASQAKKEGMADEKNIRIELENMEDEILARTYDQEINKDKGPMPPFGFIGEDRVKEFWGETGNASEKPAEPKENAEQPKPGEESKPGEEAKPNAEQPKAPETEAKPEMALKADEGFFESIGNIFSNADVRKREAKFDKFLNAKLELMKESNPQMADKEPSEEELKQIRDYFAKIQIYADEAREKMDNGELSEEFKQKVELQTKLQQANLLASLYSKKIAEKAEVTEEDIDKYIAENPELDPKAKKAEAEKILKRAQDGEDFAKLADEFSQDPGNQGPDGKKKGGLYEDVPMGKMVPEFEKAALALEPGQIAPQLVETQFGYHIIKLDRKGETKDDKGQSMGESYDVRHILIGTGVKDPENPMSREMPVRDMVKGKLAKEKQEKILEEILANNPVEIPEDFKVPEVSEEELQKMQQQMMQQQMPQQMPQQQGENAPPPPAPKPDAKPDAKK